MSGPVRAARAGGRGAKNGRSVSAARHTAFEILRRVEDEGAFAAPLLAAATAELRADDRALCYELVLGCLRWQLWLDKVAEHYAGRDAATLDAPVRRALRLGLYQLRFLSRVPARAAVNESVNLAHAARLRSAASLINAVLRRATREPEFDPATGIEGDAERLSVETSHPEWLAARWIELLGLEEASAFARANNRSAPIAFRINRRRAEPSAVFERLRHAGGRIEPSRLAPDAWRLEEGTGSVLLREMAGAGLIYMQDEASQLVAHVVAARAGERVLDTCAAPGSKTTHLATLGGDDTLVVAGDVYEHRLRVVEELAARLGLRGIRTIILDATRPLPFVAATFDAVLVDAPCTGTGTLRHNPEIRWRIRPEDIRELAAKQQLILSNGALMVRRGGRLVYSTCSVEREENEEVVAQFLLENRDFRQVAASPAPDALLTLEGAARIWPQRDDADGFFVAAFRRSG